MAAIYKREMHSYLTSAVGYVFLAVFFAISGYYFFATSLVSNSTDLSYVFSNLFSIAIFLVPLLTMKLFSEERKQRTEQLLFTAPVRFTGVVLGKFFASLTMYLLGMSVTLVYFLVMCAFRVPDVAVFAGNFLGLLLLGAALCAIGIFISALTESQVIAAVGSLAIGMFLLFANSFTPVVSNQLLNKVMDAISFYDHYLSFTRGLIHLSDLTFFISVSVLFLFLTVRHLERRRISCTLWTACMRRGSALFWIGFRPIFPRTPMVWRTSTASRCMSIRIPERASIPTGAPRYLTTR